MDMSRAKIQQIRVEKNLLNESNDPKLILAQEIMSCIHKTFLSYKDKRVIPGTVELNIRNIEINDLHENVVKALLCTITASNAEMMIEVKELKKPLELKRKHCIVDAFQMTKERVKDNSEWPAWLSEALSSLTVGTDCFVFSTPEETHLLNFDDYITQDSQGKISSCGHDVFEYIYKLVKE